MWVWALLGPMHQGINTGPLRPKSSTKLKEPRAFAKAPDGPHTYFLNIFWVQKKRTQVGVPEWGQGLILT